MNTPIVYYPIGRIHSPFYQTGGMPIQPCGAIGIKGSIELFPEFQEGLKDLEGFSHLILIYDFHLSTSFSLTVKPFLDESTHGTFATRVPSRPNSLGISIVKLIQVNDEGMEISDIDVVDGTPLLDIKPYVPQFDSYPDASIGWLKKTIQHSAEIRSDNRFRENI